MIARIGNILGLLLLFLGVSELVPILVAISHDEFSLIMPFFISALFTIFIGGALFLSFQDLQENAGKHEIILFLVVLWGILPLFAALPFMVTGFLTKLTDAYFEATSALTTTGSSVIATIEIMPRTLLFWRSLLQWEGGILVFVLAVAILPMSNIGALNLFHSALPHGEGHGLRAKMKYAFMPLIKIYVLMTLICIFFLVISGMNFFDAMNTAMATLSSGGFTNPGMMQENGFGALGHMILIPFMIFAATNLTFHWAFFSQGRPAVYKNDPELSYFLMILFVGFILIWIALSLSSDFVNMGVLEKLEIASFTAVSSLSTTGFYPEEAGKLPLTIIVICVIMLFIGGTTGSTAGGFKVLRVKLLMRHADREINRLTHPNGVIPLRLDNSNIAPSTMMSIWTLLFIFLTFIAVATIIYGILGLEFQTSLGLTIANMFSAGGMTPLLSPDFIGYHSLANAGKWLTSAIMILGRLEIIIFLILFMPTYWKN